MKNARILRVADLASADKLASRPDRGDRVILAGLAHSTSRGPRGVCGIGIAQRQQSAVARRPHNPGRRGLVYRPLPPPSPGGA
jgi:hypothetical protein